MINKQNNYIRKGCQDMWNAFMLNNAEFTLGSDMPICPCTATSIPQKLISFTEAKHIYKTNFKKDPIFHVDAFIHFYIDDQKFDAPRNGIWSKPYEALNIIKHFSGAITPDFSTNSDFPDAIKRYNTLRMRQFGYWLTTQGIAVINNVRWGTEETWEYCFDGIPYNSIVAIGTVASGLRELKNRPLFEAGLLKMVTLIHPDAIIVYGSVNYEFFKNISIRGFPIYPFESQTNLAFRNSKGGVYNEQTK